LDQVFGAFEQPELAHLEFLHEPPFTGVKGFDAAVVQDVQDPDGF
jgi:hypothetical protein